MYDKPNLENTLGEVVASAGKTQLRMAETKSTRTSVLQWRPRSPVPRATGHGAKPQGGDVRLEA